MLNRTEEEILNNWKGDINKPLVSICCTTYNHENYIAQALDGFLMQKTDFPFEIIVRDDASPDNTANIIKEYEKRYPHIIKPIYEEENCYSKGVRAMPTVFKKAEGSYLATCEGDDFWIDENKLQLQINFLENNKDFSMSFHESNIFDQDTNKIIGSYPAIHHDKDLTIYDFIRSNLSSTATMIYRKYGNIKLPINFDKFKLQDWPKNILYSEKGKVKYHSNIMATYRIHSNGVWNGISEVKRNRHTIFMLKEMREHFKYKFRSAFEDVILKQLYQQVKFYIELDQPNKAYCIYKRMVVLYNPTFIFKVRLFIKVHKTLCYNFFFTKKVTNVNI